MSQLPLSYKDVAFILKKVSERKGSIKSLLTEVSKKTPNVYALAIKVIKNIKTIKSVISESSLKSRGNSFIVEVLVGDLLFGKGLQNVPQVEIVEEILSHEEELRAIYKKHSSTKNKEKGNKNDKEAIGKDKEYSMRYVRVNLIKTNLKTIIKKLTNKGFEQIEYDGKETDFEKFKKLALKLSKTQFMIDYHFKNDLLVFSLSASNKLQKLAIYKNSKIVFQDKGSLLAVECLDLKKGMKILDVCCAPGMKTQAIASRLNNQATITSIDLDQERLNQMKGLLTKSDVTCSNTRKMDFTELSPESVGTVDVILLDPSCSGSGIHRRIGDDKNEKNKKRLYKLASFQTKMLCKAMTFNSKRIVYSTCSLSLIENEFVIKSALEEYSSKYNYKVIKTMPNWPLRGIGDFKFANNCIRADGRSLTNGSFVCVLEKQ